MLDFKQILQVFLAAVAAVAALWAFSQVAGFVITHIAWLGAATVVFAAFGLWYLSQEKVKPKA